MLRLVLAFPAAILGLALVLPALLLLLPFGLLWAITHLFARLVEPAVTGGPVGEDLIEYDPELGWRPGRNLDTHYLVRRDDVYPVVTDSEGWPGRQSLEESEVVAVGDSFVTGYGARKGEAFWERISRFPIKTVGSPGYGMTQELEVIRHLGERLAGKLVFWLVYLENDIPDAMRPHWRGYRKPFVRYSPQSKEWEVVTHHLREEKWRHSGERDNMRSFANLCVPGPFSDLHFSACEFLLGEGAATCRSAGADLVVATVPNVNQLSHQGHRFLSGMAEDPQAFDPDYPDLRLGESCARLGVPFLPMKGFLEASDYKRLEKFHWSPRGHRKVAGQIERIHDTWRSGRLGERLPSPTRSGQQVSA